MEWFVLIILAYPPKTCAYFFPNKKKEVPPVFSMRLSHERGFSISKEKYWKCRRNVLSVNWHRLLSLTFSPSRKGHPVMQPFSPAVCSAPCVRDVRVWEVCCSPPLCSQLSHCSAGSALSPGSASAYLGSALWPRDEPRAIQLGLRVKLIYAPPSAKQICAFTQGLCI